MKKIISIIFLSIFLSSCTTKLSTNDIENIISKSTDEVFSHNYEDKNLETNSPDKYYLQFRFNDSLEIYGWILDSNLLEPSPFTFEFNKDILRYTGTDNNFMCRVKMSDF